MPQIEQGLDVFANWQTAVFAVSIYLMTRFIRAVVEKGPTKQWAATNWLWKGVLVPFGPIANGMFLALLAKKFPWPMPIGHTISAKLMYGVFVGSLCALLYARIRDWARTKSVNTTAAKPTAETADSLAPPADDESAL